MFSRPLQYLIVIYLTSLYFISMADRVRVITEMNIISVISCAYLHQLGFSCLKSKQKSVILLSCLFCCWYVFVIWISLKSKSTHINYGRSHNSSLLVNKKLNLYNTSISKRLFQKYKDDNYQHIFSFSQVSRQKCWVFPSSLETYFQELENNRNNARLMRFEWARYETFKTFPFDSPVMPIRLASNGFYYNGSSDSVTCFSCGLEYRGWREGDSVADIHARLSPDCHLIVGADQTNIGIHAGDVQGATGGGSSVTDGSIRSGEVYVQRQSRQSEASGTSLYTQPRHKYPDHENYHYRMNTFTGWPCTDVIDPERLVSAGFFYAGISDCVRCFSCGGGLRNWEYGDSPWEEHARWFPECCFLREQKGSEFIRQHREVQSGCDEQESSSTAIVSGEEALNTVKGNRGSKSPSVEGTASNVKTNYRESKMSTEKLLTQQTLLSMGFYLADIQPSLGRIAITDVTESTIETVLDDMLKHSQAHGTEHSDKIASTYDQKQLHHSTDATAEQATLKGATNSSIELDPKDLQEENSRLIDQLTCKICMDKESNVVFIPCGHMVSCETCAPHIRKCAICRQPIKGRVKAFMS
ncbi:baculoviral IAP repeat-containing protein 7-like [Mercenaria mercenaria]|uniref:baculoviral IAP repeat-containing protein 7-like n=1 Tax=Mercenaria mercenaria TaxID=6596 RepID=UPI00234EA9FB|nr:baculoviral IAP repeat-containing protein 7-like [Mercenaria mercenaria]